MTFPKSESEIQDLIQSLPMDFFNYRDTILSYAEYIQHDVISPNFAFDKNPKYFSKKDPKEPTKIMRVHWTSEELDALYKGIIQFGVGHWKEIYEQNKEIFQTTGINETHLKEKYYRVKDIQPFSELPQ